MLSTRDADLVQIVERELAEATDRARKPDGSSWLACRPGCTPCCHGVFRISMLDAERLRAGLLELDRIDGARANRIRTRAVAFVAELRHAFPGDERTGLLNENEADWDAFADLPQSDRACPVLDPTSGTCELYPSRPMTCRVFGPPVQTEDGIGVCELCYVGASEEEIQEGQMVLEHASLEEALTAQLPPGETIIAWALSREEV